MTPSQTPQTPLETLVAAQLDALRKQEESLRLRLSLDLPSEQSTSVVSALSKLQMSTDRLSRMVDAMPFIGRDWSISVVPIAA